MGGGMNVREVGNYNEVLIGKHEIKKLYLYPYVRSYINVFMHVRVLLHVY